MTDAEDRNIDLPDNLGRFKSECPLFMEMKDRAGVPLAAAFHVAASREQRLEAIHLVKQQYENEGFGAGSDYSKEMMLVALFITSFALQQEDARVAHSITHMLAKIFDKADEKDAENAECKRGILATVFRQNLLQQEDDYPVHIEKNARNLLDILIEQTGDDIVEQAVPDDVKEEILPALKIARNLNRKPSTLFIGLNNG